METFYKGDEVKFAINYKAPGFSMDDDDFEIEVKVSNTGVKGYKNSESGSSTDIVIFKENELPETEKRYNISAVQAGGSYASTILGNGEVWLVSTTNSLDNTGAGTCDAYIVGDGKTTASNLELKQGDVWYAIVDTKNLPVGTMRVIVTGHIIDANANDGVRDDIAVAVLGKLVTP